MAFIGIIGNQGSGKTALMTDWLYRAACGHLRVVSNYHLGCRNKSCTLNHLIFPHTRTTFSEVAEDPDLIYKSYVGFDELGVGADSYEFFTEKGRGLAKLVTQLRKREATVLYTVQRFSLINSRLRAQTSRFILCEDQDIDKHAIDRAHVCEGQFKIGIYDENHTYVRSLFFNAKRTWNLYATNQLINA